MLKLGLTHAHSYGKGWLFNVRARTGLSFYEQSISIGGRVQIPPTPPVNTPTPLNAWAS